jgi:hypothetical protein
MSADTAVDIRDVIRAAMADRDGPDVPVEAVTPVGPNRFRSSGFLRNARAVVTIAVYERLPAQ